jgi:outer membrane protein assembly factor BamD (BamD/ComL family)
MVRVQQDKPEPAPDIAAAPQSAVNGPYASGLALERRGDFAGAASELAQAAEKEPSHADLALYALGRLFQHRLNDPRRALETFERYRSHYPHGTLSQEVDLAVLEIDVQTDDHRNALAESARFLAAHPASERTAEVHALRGNLLRGGGDCRKALAEYAAAATSSFAEAALYGTARCQKELGNAAAASEALRAYHARFPAGPHHDEVARDLAAKDF